MTEDSKLLLVKADGFEYRGETGANAARMAMDAEAGPGCLDIDWELVEYAEGVSKAAEELERAERSRSLFFGNDVTLTVDDAAQPEPVGIGVDVEKMTYEGEFSIEAEEESNVEVESPDWYVEDEGEPDGHVACPNCPEDWVGYTFDRNLQMGGRVERGTRHIESESPEFMVACGVCGWFQSYGPDEAYDMFDLYRRAENSG